MGPAQIIRLMHIAWTLVRYRLDEIILGMHLFRPFRFLRYLLPWHWLARKSQIPRGERLRQALEELGPLFIKFGQILSTRRDLLPDDIAIELARLQDHVHPFPSRIAREIIEKSLGDSIENLFIDFEEQQLASASIAQVHAAKLKDGREIVIKVVRPNIDAIIKKDLKVLYNMADLAEKYWPDVHRLHPRAVVREFEKTLMDELDLLREAANASQLRRNFLNSSILYVPEIHWELTRQNVLVMERIRATPISDIASLREHRIDLEHLSERGVEIFFTQVFHHNFFHADMHPGNIFVAPDGKYIAVDFGIMGSLGPEDQSYLAQNFFAFFNRDYRQVAQLHIDSRWVSPDTRVDEFEGAIRTVCEPIFQRPLKDISFGHLLLRLFQTARRFNMEIQPQLVLLQKTLLNIEGLGRQLYPELDLWRTAKPFFERWMKDHYGPLAIAKQLRYTLPKWIELLPQLPDLMKQTMLSAADKQKRADDSHDRMSYAKLSYRVNVAILSASALISAAVIYGLDSHASYNFAGVPLLSWGLLMVAMVLGLAALSKD